MEHQGYQGTSCYVARMGAWSAHRPFPWRGPQPPLQKILSYLNISNSCWGDAMPGSSTQVSTANEYHHGKPTKKVTLLKNYYRTWTIKTLDKIHKYIQLLPPKTNRALLNKNDGTDWKTIRLYVSSGGVPPRPRPSYILQQSWPHCQSRTLQRPSWQLPQYPKSSTISKHQKL